MKNRDCLTNRDCYETRVDEEEKRNMVCVTPYLGVYLEEYFFFVKEFYDKLAISLQSLKIGQFFPALRTSRT